MKDLECYMTPGPKLVQSLSICAVSVDRQQASWGNVDLKATLGALDQLRFF